MSDNSSSKFSRRDALKLLGLGGIAATSGLLSTDTISAQTANAPIIQPVTNSQGAGFYKFKVGAMTCFVISDGVLNAPPIPLFAANVKKEEAEQALRDYFLPTDSAITHVNALIVKSGDKVLLIDTGSGNNFGESAGKLSANLGRAGISPEQITDVAFTHAHGDHAGGNIDANGKIVFPNARFHIAQREWETWMTKNVSLGQTKVDEKTAKFYIELSKKSLSPLKDRITLFKPNAEIITGVSSIPANGHTPGHTAFLISSGKDSLMYAGDFAHHFAFQIVHPEWFTSVDYDTNQAVATRKKLLDRLATDKTLVAGSHLPFPAIGHIRARNATRTSYEFVPIVWDWTA